MTLVEAMEYLYDREINCQVGSFWDGGFELCLGDNMNGFKDFSVFDADELDTKGAQFLIDQADLHYPNRAE